MTCSTCNMVTISIQAYSMDELSINYSNTHCYYSVNSWLLCIISKWIHLFLLVYAAKYRLEYKVFVSSTLITNYLEAFKNHSCVECSII